jgi:uncharacterized membrane protein
MAAQYLSYLSVMEVGGTFQSMYTSTCAHADHNKNKNDHRLVCRIYIGLLTPVELTYIYIGLLTPVSLTCIYIGLLTLDELTYIYIGLLTPVSLTCIYIGLLTQDALI